jgi:hypothetical protein
VRADGNYLIPVGYVGWPTEINVADGDALDCCCASTIESPGLPSYLPYIYSTNIKLNDISFAA